MTPTTAAVAICHAAATMLENGIAVIGISSLAFNPAVQIDAARLPAGIVSVTVDHEWQRHDADEVKHFRGILDGIAVVWVERRSPPVAQSLSADAVCAENAS